MKGVKMLSAGEQGLVVEFGSVINAEVNTRVHQITQLIKTKLAGEIIEVVPTYRSLLIYFDPLLIKRSDLIQHIESLLSEVSGFVEQKSQGMIVSIPVCYGGEYGPDLEFVASYNGLTVEEVIHIHTATPYLVYMIGFTPGFPYLGGMSDRIATPRLKQPRTEIPAGSVGIAGSQTGLYPIQSPGGWRLIGRTPIRAFNPESPKPFLFEAGNYLQFVSISAEEYVIIQRKVELGTYIPMAESVDGGVKSCD